MTCINFRRLKSNCLWLSNIFLFNLIFIITVRQIIHSIFYILQKSSYYDSFSDNLHQILKKEDNVGSILHDKKRKYKKLGADGRKGFLKMKHLETLAATGNCWVTSCGYVYDSVAHVEYSIRWIRGHNFKGLTKKKDLLRCIRYIQKRDRQS